MQQRFRILTADSFEEASRAKAALATESPDKTFQIRGIKDNRFALVERVPITKAKSNLKNEPPVTVDQMASAKWYKAKRKRIRDASNL